MQANGNITPSQFSTLQTVLTFLESVTASLDTDARPTYDTDVELTRAVRNLGLYCRDRLLESFPALAEWRALGGGGE